MDLEHQLASYSVNIIYIATVVLVLLAAISLKLKKPKEATKKILFYGIVAATVIPTLFASLSTVYLNSVSSSGGPVHWHADFEVWACGQELDLIDPKGWSNKIGTATLHEHNDKRVHLEGVVVKPEDASLGKFFRVIGGELTQTALTMQTTNGPVMLQSGQSCLNGELAEVQVFVFKVDKDKYYSQQKVSDPQSYIISPYSSVPDGDCVIVEFGPVKERTDKLCRSYKVAEEIDKLKGEKEVKGVWIYGE